MTEMIAERAKELQMGLDEHHDLFSKLMKANIEETNPARRITDMELMADTLYVFYVYLFIYWRVDVEPFVPSVCFSLAVCFINS